MTIQTFGDVWDAIEKTPQEAENMRLRSSLMRAIEQHIRAQPWTQMQAAQTLGVTQPRVSQLMRGKIEMFSLDMLVNIAVSAGLSVEMRVQEAA